MIDAAAAERRVYEGGEDREPVGDRGEGLERRQQGQVITSYKSAGDTYLEQRPSSPREHLPLVRGGLGQQQLSPPPTHVTHGVQRDVVQVAEYHQNYLQTQQR